MENNTFPTYGLILVSFLRNSDTKSEVCVFFFFWSVVLLCKSSYRTWLLTVTTCLSTTFNPTQEQFLKTMCVCVFRCWHPPSSPQDSKWLTCLDRRQSWTIFTSLTVHTACRGKKKTSGTLMSPIAQGSEVNAVYEMSVFLDGKWTENAGVIY